MKKYIITGASGFIGQALSKKILTDGDYVYGIVRDRNKVGELTKYNNFEPIELEMDCYNKIDRIIKDKIDVFFHLAWNGYGTATNDPIVQYKNVIDSIKALQCAINMKVGNFIFTGTCYEYLKDRKYNDNRLCSVYGASKKSFKEIAYIIARDSDTRFNSTIFSHVFGVGDYNKRMSHYILNCFIKGVEPQINNPNMIFDWTYIDDVIESLLKISDLNCNGKDYYIGNFEGKTIKDIVVDIANILGYEKKMNFRSNNLDSLYVDYSNIETKLLCKDTEINLSENDFSQGIIKTYNWIKKEIYK